MERSDNQSGAAHALVEIQNLAAKRRADAEASLEEARSVERFAAEAATAHLAQRDAAEQVRTAREHLEAIVAQRETEIGRYAELRDAEDAARTELERAQESLRFAKQTLQDATRARLAHPVPATEPGPHEAEACAGYEEAVRSFEQCRDARTRADAKLAELQVRLEPFSGTSGLNADAAKRVLERRITDTLRNGTTAGPA
jgi:multidrug efflux pump subunit AcrA (membrane-fusion protein)